jgi:hypothetical protein
VNADIFFSAEVYIVNADIFFSTEVYIVNADIFFSTEVYIGNADIFFSTVILCVILLFFFKVNSTAFKSIIQMSIQSIYLIKSLVKLNVIELKNSMHY